MSIAIPCSYGYGGTIKPHHTNSAGDPMPNCDCDATPEDVTAGIHQPGCTSLTGPADDPSDHYSQ